MVDVGILVGLATEPIPGLLPIAHVETRAKSHVALCDKDTCMLCA